MKKIKSFFSRFKDEKGFGILGLLTIAGLISFAVGTHSFIEYAKNENKKVKDSYEIIQNLDVPGDTADANKTYNEVLKIIADAFVEGGKHGIGSVFDETGGLGIVKETGIFDIPKDKKKEQENSDPIFNKGLLGAVKIPAEYVDVLIEEKLDENNLPTDAITQDITKIVINIANGLGSCDSEIADIIDISIDVIKDLTNKDKGIDNDSTEALEIVKEKLSKINKLEDEEIINKRREYNLSVLHKEQLLEELEIYQHYKDTETIIISNKYYNQIKETLDHLDDKIGALEKDLREYEEKSEEEKTEDMEGAPTIKLIIVAGPTYSEADEACYYIVKAKVTGDPDPAITFSKDNSGGALGSDSTKINLKDGVSYTLKATATNSEGSATASIYLPWGCAVDAEDQDMDDVSTDTEEEDGSDSDGDDTSTDTEEEDGSDSDGDDTSTDTEEDGGTSSDYDDDPFGFGNKDVDLPEGHSRIDDPNWDYRMDEDGNWGWWYLEQGYWYEEENTY
jgi:hypothetical protein